MRIVVQHPRTGCYLHEAGGWTKDVTHARDFLSSADAMAARQQQHLAEANLVFRFEREGYSIAVPLEPLPPPLRAVPPPFKDIRAARKQDMLIG